MEKKNEKILCTEDGTLPTLLDVDRYGRILQVLMELDGSADGAQWKRRMRGTILYNLHHARSIRSDGALLPFFN